MFVGYTPKWKVQTDSLRGNEIANQLAALLVLYRGEFRQFRTDELRLVNLEIGRLASMVGIGTPDLFPKFSIQLQQDNLTVQEDIHWLICMARIAAQGDSSMPADRELLASTLADLPENIRLNHLSVDRNFEPRLTTLCQAWGKDFELALATQLSGAKDQLFLIRTLGPAQKGLSLQKFCNESRSILNGRHQLN